ncbi:hypothetical protein AYJ58_12090 [Shewanella sp. Pdp11]|nr:hypothetical protein AYJ58_12090 [Shewanella sp. Pdp11]
MFFMYTVNFFHPHLGAKKNSCLHIAKDIRRRKKLINKDAVNPFYTILFENKFILKRNIKITLSCLFLLSQLQKQVK